LDIDSLTRLCANVRKQNTTTDTTTTAAQTTSNLPQKGKRKRKRKHNINPATCGYKDEGDDVQDYSSSGLKYNNDTTKIWRLNGEAVVDIEEFKKGRGMLHATVATNMLNSPYANLAAHDHGELLGGILGNGLKPMVQTNKTSENPMEKVWALPYGCWMLCVFHVLNTHGKALQEAGGYVALIMIPEDDPRMDLFAKFGAGCAWAQTCYPAHSMGFYVCLDDVFVVNINDLPACLKQTQVHSNMVKLKTDAEKKATRAAYQASDQGKATRAAYQASDHGKATRAAYINTYENSDHGKATKAAYEASDHGMAKRAAYHKTRLEKNRAKSALKRATTKLECGYCNAVYYSPRGINEHQKQCTKRIE
jgi:hypothetical protein